MPCLLTLLAVFFPRIVMALIAVFTYWFSESFNTVFWPVLGFIFMPYTTLAYMGAMLNNHHTVNGFWMVLVIVAALIDLGGQGGSMRRRRWRRR